MATGNGSRVEWGHEIPLTGRFLVPGPLLCSPPDIFFARAASTDLDMQPRWQRLRAEYVLGKGGLPLKEFICHPTEVVALELRCLGIVELEDGPCPEGATGLGVLKATVRVRGEAVWRRPDPPPAGWTPPPSPP